MHQSPQSAVSRHAGRRSLHCQSRGHRDPDTHYSRRSSRRWPRRRGRIRFPLRVRFRMSSTGETSTPGDETATSTTIAEREKKKATISISSNPSNRRSDVEIPRAGCIAFDQRAPRRAAAGVGITRALAAVRKPHRRSQTLEVRVVTVLGVSQHIRQGTANNRTSNSAIVLMRSCKRASARSDRRIHSSRFATRRNAGIRILARGVLQMVVRARSQHRQTAGFLFR